jgi:hypothetical protein
MSSVHLAKKFIIDRIVKSELETGDVLDYLKLYGFTNYNLEINDIMKAVDELAKNGLVEKIVLDKQTAIKLTVKGYKQLNNYEI